MIALPGEDLVQEGIRALGAGEETAEGLLVSISSTRLRALGLSVPAPLDNPRERLYRMLQRDYGDGAHARFNALLRRIDSYCSCAACAK